MVADQAANMKKAFSNEYESIDCDEIQLLINDLKERGHEKERSDFKR